MKMKTKMKAMKQRILFFVFVLSLCFTSCDGDDVKVTARSLVGYWQCTYQQWVEDGEEWHSNYGDNDNYYIEFEDDFTGRFDSEEDQLLERMGYHTFNWSVSGNDVILNMGHSSEDIFRVCALTEDYLELYWEDGDYHITCKFKKVAD